MVAVKSAGADRYLASPPDGIRMFLLYGADAGAVTERAQAVERVALQRGGGDTLRFASDIISAEPGRIAEEASSASLFGGEPVVRLRVVDGRHNVMAALQPLLERPPEASWVIVEAGELPPASALRKAFEASAHAAAVPSYLVEGGELLSFIRNAAADAGVQVEPAAIELLGELLGGDRLAVRGEIEKLFLYVADSGLVRVEDVEAIVGETGAVRTDQVVDAAMLGNHESLEAGLGSLRSEGSSAAGLATQALRHLLLLSGLRDAVEEGSSVSAAIDRARPPVFARRRAAVEAALRLWPGEALSEARRRLAAAIALTRTLPALEEQAVSQALHEIALMARRLKRGPAAGGA